MVETEIKVDDLRLERILSNLGGALPSTHSDSVYASLVEKVRSSSVSRGTSSSLLHYSALQTDVEELVRIEDQIEKGVNSQRSWYSKAGYYLRSWIFKLMGKPAYTVEQLFDVQLDHIGKINTSLRKINVSARDELVGLEGYSVEVMDNYEQLAGRRGELKTGMRETLDDLAVVEKALTGASGEDRFQYVKARATLCRRVLEYKHDYEMGNEAIVDLERESKFLDVIETTTRLSLHMCESLYEKTERLSRHVKHTKRIYEQLNRQQSTAASLFEALDTLGRYTVQIHTILGEGVERLSTTTQNFNLGDFYSGRAEQFSDVNADVFSNESEVNHRLDEEVECILAGEQN